MKTEKSLYYEVQKREIENATDIKKLKEVAIGLLKLTYEQQEMFSNLLKRDGGWK